MTGVKGHIYQTLEFANGKSMPFILDTGSVESLFASADLRKFCPETAVQPTSAVIQGVTGHHLSLLGQTETPIRSSTQKIRERNKHVDILNQRRL